MIDGNILLMIGIGLIVLAVLLFVVSIIYGRTVSTKLKKKIREEY